MIRVAIIVFFVFTTATFSQLINGPERIQTDFWQQTNGPYVIYINALAASPNGYVFCAMNSVGVFRSSDQGNNWELIKPSGDHYLGMEINKEGHIFLIGSLDFSRSTDNGNTWTVIDIGYPYIAKRSVAFRGDGEVFLGSWYDGVFYSSDNGDSWTMRNSGMETEYISALEIDRKGILYAGASNSVFKSTDTGMSWTRINKGLPEATITSLVVNQNGYIFAGFGTYGSTSHGIYRSTDDGESWEEINNGLLGKNVWNLVIDSDGHIFAGTGGKGVFRSTNNGDNWELLNKELTNRYTFVLDLDYAGNIFANIGNGMFFSSDNGETWIEKNEGLRYLCPQINSLEINSNDDIIAGTNGQVFKSTDNGDNWIIFEKGLPEETNSRVYSLSTIENFFASNDSGLFVLEKNSEIWKPTNLRHRVYSISGNSDNILFAAADINGVYTSADNGLNWIRTNSPQGIKKISVNYEDHIVGGSDEGIFISTDNGNNWNKTDFNIEVSLLAVSPMGYVFAFSGRDIYRSKTGETNWEQVESASEFPVSSVIINKEGHIYAGSWDGGGIYLSMDDGMSWENTEIDSWLYWVGDIAINSRGYIFAGATVWEPLDAGFLGVYRSIESTTSVKEVGSYQIPSEFVLFQNYPNPFNPSTVIKYNLPVNGFVSLKVYDILGNEIKALVNEMKSAGTYNAQFNAANLASGVYFYRILVMAKDGEFNASKKLILAK